MSRSLSTRDTSAMVVGDICKGWILECIGFKYDFSVQECADMKLMIKKEIL